MRQLMGRIGSIGAVACLVAGGAGCVENNSSVFIRQVQAVTLDNDCIVEADPEAQHITQGVLDVSIAQSYVAVLLVGNQLVSRADPDTLKVETSRVVFHEAEVEVFDFSGGSVGAFSIPVSGFADPGTGQQPGFGFVDAILIDPATGANLAPNQTVVSRIKLFGETLGGTDVETGNFDFPIAVCSECLGCAVAECGDDVECPCHLGQDEGGFDCRCIGGACNTTP